MPLSQFGLKVLVAAAAVSALTGCHCGTTTNKTAPDYRPTPTALSFSACPTKDETGAAVKDVFPDTQKLSIQNAGVTPGGLKLTLSGPDADAFKLPDMPPTGIAGNTTVDLDIGFSPAKKGSLRATLTIDDVFDGTDNPTVDLVGEGKNLPAQPTVETAAQQPDAGYSLCVEGSPLTDCSLNFPDTLFGDTQTMTVKLRNKGCPTLKVTELSIESSRGDSQGFAIVQPAQAPSDISPLTLNTADGTQELSIVISFTPVDDGSGNLDRSAALVIKSNDPLYGDGFGAPARLALYGNGFSPAIYALPSFCDFSNPLDGCGNSPKIANKATIVVTNDGSKSGNQPVKISAVAWASTGSETSGVGGRFTVPSGIKGRVIAANATTTFDIDHNDMPLYVSDQLVLTAVLAADGTTPAGSATIALFGGTKPCLSTEPTDQVNFNNPMTDVSAQTVKIKNGAGCGTLVINEVAIDPSPFFALADPKVMPGTMVPAGTNIEATVSYTRPPSGGMQLGTMRIRSNDSDFGPPQYKLVQLLSQSPLDEVPVAQITGCTPSQLSGDPDCANGSTPSLLAYLSQITGATKQLTISGVTSYDPDVASPGGKKAVAKFKFSLLPPFPSGVTTANLANHDMVITTPTTTLTLPAGGVGLYRISLVVYDDRNQQSGNTAILNANVYQ